MAAKETKEKEIVASMGRWVDNSSRGLQASVGKFKAGVQHLSNADLQRIKSTKR